MNELEEEKGIVSPGEEPRVSDIHPRNWASLFPTQGKLARAGKPGASNKILVAGSLHAVDLDLQRMQVVVRIRPLTGRGADKGSCIHAYSQSCLAMAPPEGSKMHRSGDREEEDCFTSFTFSRVFGPDASQRDFYGATAAPMVRGLMDSGLSSVMMAYGVSGAGKTYTMEGVPGEWGVIFLSIQSIFEEASREDQIEKPIVKISHYEIYREKVHDLLANVLPAGPGPKPLGPQPALNVRDDAKGRVIVDGLTEVEVSNTAEAYRILRHSCRQERKRAPTGANDWSSRSHSIITVALWMPELDLPGSAPANEQAASSSGSTMTPWGRLSFVDLAGNERADRTGNTGQRMEESKAINKSLFNLQACLRELRWNQQNATDKEPRNVPYRASKLTHLLRDVLHGWGQLLMCVNVSPTATDFEATVDTLRYATLARRIGTAARAQPPARAIRAKTPNIIKRRQARQSMRPKVDPKAKRLKSSTACDLPQLASLGDTSDPEDLQMDSSSKENGAMEAISEGEDERVMDLEAEVEELREQLAEAEKEQLRLEEHQVVIADLVRGEVCEEWRSVISQMADEHEAKRTEEVRALKERHQKEVAALEQQLQEAASKPRKQAKKGRAGSGESAPPSAALQQENAALRQRAQDLQLAADQSKAELRTFKEQAQRDAANAAECIAEFAAALQAQVAATQSADEALNSVHRSHRADILSLRDSVRAAVQDHQAAERVRLGVLQENQALTAKLTEARQRNRELEAEVAAQAEARNASFQAFTSLQAAQAEAAKTIATLQLRLTKESSAREVSERAGVEAREALANVRAAAEAKKAERQAEVDASRAAWEAERPRLEEAQAHLEEMKVQLEADASMRVHMLERELARAQKDIVALRCQLRCQPGSVTNPAVLRAAAAEGAQDGPKGRGAAGTPHNIALARAIAEAQLSPLQSTPVQQSAPTPEQATDAAAHLQPPAVHASAPAEMPGPDHGASPHVAADAAALEPVSAAQLHAPQPDHPTALGTAVPEQAPPNTASAQAAPEARKAGKRRSTIPGKSMAVQPEPARLPGPDTQKPRTRRQTMAAAGHASDSLASVSQAGPKKIVRVASGSSRPTSPAEDGPDKAVVASQEIAPRARQTRRASVAPQLRGKAETSRKDVGCVAEQLPAGRPKRRRGASMAAAPDQAAEAGAEPQPFVKGTRCTAEVPRKTAVHDQGAAQSGFADDAFPAPCSLDTIREDEEEENQQDEKAGLPSIAADGSSRKPSPAASAAVGGAQQFCMHAPCEAPTQDGLISAGQRAEGGEQHNSTILQTGDIDKQVPEAADRQLPVLREDQTSTDNGGREKGPVRRSARRAVLAARPCSAHGQPACSHSASPVMDHAGAPSGQHASAAKGIEQPCSGAGARVTAQAHDPARRRAGSKENAVSIVRPPSARSQKPTAIAQEPPAKKTRKRKLLPGKCADNATAQALYGTLDSDALPLKTLATPVAMRVRRRLR